jgi:general secretion pathway protein G
MNIARSSVMVGRKSREAFTLIELLLVLVILAVLAAVVVPKFTGRQKDAKISAAKADISNLETSLETYEVDNGEYPSTQQTLQALVEAPAGVKNWKGPYVKKLPNDPWGNPYVYTSPGTHTTGGYDIQSYGPDGRDGGGDDIVSWTTTQ